MTRLLPVLALTLTLPACIIYGGSGDSLTLEREFDALTAVDNASELDVIAVSGAAEQSVQVTCDDNLHQFIQTEEVDGALRINVEKDDGLPVLMDPQVDCRVEVAVASLERLLSSGSGDSDASGDLTGFRELSTTGSGDSTLTGVDSEQVSILTTGSGDVTAAGVALTVEVITSGSGDVLARELIAETAVVRTSGSGDVQVTATGTVDIETTGSGDVDVWGGPDTVLSDTAGSGDVNLHGDQD